MKKLFLSCMIVLSLAICAFADGADYNAVAKPYTDAYGADHPDGIHVLESVIILRAVRRARITFASYHSAAARAAGAKPTGRYQWESPVVENLSAVDFDALNSWVVQASLSLDAWLAGGTPITIED
jgi:hypothetical protein